MKRSGRVKWGELRVGILLLFGFALLMWASFTGTGFSVFRKTEPLVAFFPSVNGMITGSPVWMSGLEVGYVSGVNFAERDGQVYIKVDFLVTRKNFNMITTSAHAAVGTMGLMGDKYLDIRLGPPGGVPVKPGDALQAISAADMTTAFSGAPAMMDQITGSLGQLTSILERINRGEGFLGGLTQDSETSENMDALVVSARKLIDDLNVTQKELTATLNETAERVNTLAAAADGDGSLGRLIHDSTLYVNLTSLTACADQVFKSLDEGEGSLGKLAADDEMYEDVRILLSDVQALINDIRLNPKKYFKVSVF